MEEDTVHYRQAIADYVRAQAQPVEKYSHQPRLYQLAVRVGQGQHYDDDVLYAAAWLHDVGVFHGHRPADVDALAAWDNVAYAVAIVPALLTAWGFPAAKIDAVLAAISAHQPARTPTTSEGVILRDADILEQLGAVGILRTSCKIGRDTRFHTFSDALATLQHALDTLPALLALPTAQTLAEPRIQVLRAFLTAAHQEAAGAPL